MKERQSYQNLTGACVSHHTTLNLKTLLQPTEAGRGQTWSKSVPEEKTLLSFHRCH